MEIANWPSTRKSKGSAIFESRPAASAALVPVSIREKMRWYGELARLHEFCAC
jgi:hypothetical protein